MAPRRRDGDAGVPNREEGGLTERLDLLWGLCKEADEFRRTLLARAGNPGPLTRVGRRFQRWWWAGIPFDPTRGGWHPAGYRRYLARYATEAERQNRLFPIVVQTYWVEHLAGAAGRWLDLGPAEVDALLAIHEVREKARSGWKRYTPAGRIGLLLVVGGFLLSQVPEEFWGGYYGLYRLNVFLLLLSGLFSYGWFWLLAREKEAAARRRLVVMEAVLTYLKVMYARGEDPRAAGEGATGREPIPASRPRRASRDRS